MARQINKLTPTKVRAENKPGLHSDGNGLYLEVSDRLTKSWTLIYQFGGKRRQKGLGSISVLGLAQAREQVRLIKQSLSQGVDPLAEPEAEVVVPNFGEVALQLIADRESGWKNKKHRQQWRNTLTTYALPIWEKPVDAITVEDVLGILRPLWNTKAETAQRVRGRIENVLDAAKVRGLRGGDNPAAWKGNLAHLLARQKKGARGHHNAMPYEDVPGFMVDLGQRSALAARALELLIHTAARTSEVLHAEWGEFDLEAAIWTIPASRMKAGIEHRVPLTPQAIAVLNALPKLGAYLFPGATLKKPLSNMAMAMMLRRMGLTDVTVHGFRSSFRDWAGDNTKFPRDVAEHALAHQVGSEVERAYRRGNAFDARRDLMKAWSQFIHPHKEVHHEE